MYPVIIEFDPSSKEAVSLQDELDKFLKSREDAVAAQEMAVYYGVSLIARMLHKALQRIRGGDEISLKKRLGGLRAMCENLTFIGNIQTEGVQQKYS